MTAEAEGKGAVGLHEFKKLKAVILLFKKIGLSCDLNVSIYGLYDEGHKLQRWHIRQMAFHTIDPGHVTLLEEESWHLPPDTLCT